LLLLSVFAAEVAETVAEVTAVTGAVAAVGWAERRGCVRRQARSQGHPRQSAITERQISSRATIIAEDGRRTPEESQGNHGDEQERQNQRESDTASEKKGDKERRPERQTE